MRDIPIIFSAPMIRALIDGRKSMTRRLAGSWRKVRDPVQKGKWLEAWRPTLWQQVKPGDRLWLRENVGRRVAITLLGQPAENGVEEAFYAADGEDVVNEHGFNLCPWWKQNQTLPCIHMPRWASRLTLVVTATRIERLTTISEEDALAEGADNNHSVHWPDGDPGTINDVRRRNFARLWRVLHGPMAWTESPEVVALSFAVHKTNIDAMPKEIAA